MPAGSNHRPDSVDATAWIVGRAIQALPVRVKPLRAPFVIFGLIFHVSGGCAFSQAIEPWMENFELRDAGHVMTTTEGWSGFQGFRGNGLPEAVVVKGKGVGGSRALAVSHAEPFRTDNWGLRITLPQPCENGVVWIQAKFKPPVQWTGGLFLDARGPERGAILGRIAAGPFEKQGVPGKKLRWHCTWTRPYWRLYTLSRLDSNLWYTVTARFDLDAGSYAAWVEDQPLGEDAPLSASGPFSHIYLGLGGTPESPALIDDLTVSREAPDGFSTPQLLPEPEDDHLFRFSGLGDPQLGFGGYETDKIRFGLAVDQVNRAGSELSLILGDMVHQNKDEKAYRELAELAKGLKSPTYIRGNHEELDLFQKYFNERSNYSLVHKGLRFVIVDATGKQRGLSGEQLSWIEAEFTAAANAGEEIVLALHVSPWQNNKQGAGAYNQIGPGRDRLRELMKEHRVLLCLSGHYHSALWGAKEEETHYLVLGGTAVVKGGTYGWCLFDVYPDRVVMHHKPLFFGYEKPGVSKVHALQDWIPYELLRQMHPYAQQGPLTIKRHRPVAK